MPTTFRAKKTNTPNTRRQTARVSNETIETCSNSSYSNCKLRPYSLVPKISRTSIHLLDYVCFLAARCIQQHWRGHYYRHLLAKRLHAAVTIQRWWRGFFVRRHWYEFVENRLQRQVTTYFAGAALKIQSNFRGWVTRQKVHDIGRLRHMQYCAAADLLSCVALKLHYLLRTHSIPGIYSLRNSHCLSRVEKLLTSIQHRYYNERASQALKERMAAKQAQIKNFTSSCHQTPVPYASTTCKENCAEFMHHTKDMDSRMFKILAMYDQSQRDIELHKKKRSPAELKRRRKLQIILDRQKREGHDFCQDIVASMRHWKVLKAHNLVIDANILHKPDNLEKFLVEMSRILGDLGTQTCHCKMPAFDEVICH